MHVNHQLFSFFRWRSFEICRGHGRTTRVLKITTHLSLLVDEPGTTLGWERAAADVPALLSMWAKILWDLQSPGGSVPTLSTPAPLAGASSGSGAGAATAAVGARDDDLPDSSAFGAAAVTPDKGEEGDEDYEFDYEEFNPYVAAAAASLRAILCRLCASLRVVGVHGVSMPCRCA